MTTEVDPIALLDRRTSINPAIGYDFFDQPDLSLSIELGGGFQNETTDGIESDSSVLDWRLRYAQDLFSGDLEIFHNHHIYKNLGGRENFVVNTESGLRFDITDDIYLNVQLNLDTDSEPAAGILTLISLWGIDYNPAAGTACGQAETQGFSCYYQRGSLNGIRQLDRPGVLTLTDSQGKTHEPVLVSLNDDVAELSFGGDHVSFPVDEVADHWFGQFLLIWRPPGGTPTAISPGMQNENVRWLRQSLAALDSNYQPQSAASDFFDEELQQQLMAFQRQHRLEADGLAGQKTQIIINSLLAQDGTPRLTSTR